MPRLSRLRQHLVPLASTLLVLVVDAVRFLQLCLCSRTSFASENLSLRMQLAQYQARQIIPHRSIHATRMAGSCTCTLRIMETNPSGGINVARTRRS